MGDPIELADGKAPRIAWAGRSIRVVVFGPHLLVREALCRLLESASEVQVVGSATRVEELAMRGPALRPDVVVAELDAPGHSPAATLMRLRSAAAGAAPVLLATSEQRGLVAAATRLRIPILYVDRSTEDELIDSVRDAAGEREELRAQGGATDGDGPVRALPHHDRAPGSLTARERDVLATLGRGVSSAEAAALLSITTQTLRAHVKSILAKLHAHSRVEAYVIAVRQGLIDPARQA